MIHKNCAKMLFLDSLSYPYTKEINFCLFAKNREKSCKKKFFLLQFTLSKLHCIADVICSKNAMSSFVKG